MRPVYSTTIRELRAAILNPFTLKLGRAVFVPVINQEVTTEQFLVVGKDKFLFERVANVLLNTI